MRLIDADALKEDIEQQCALLRLMKDNDELMQISSILESGLKAQIDKMPIIEEREKGTWIPVDKNEHYGNITTAVYYYPTCSVCGFCANYTNFCPNCGAKMKNVRSDNPYQE